MTMFKAKRFFNSFFWPNIRPFQDSEDNFHACKYIQKLPMGKDENDAESIFATKLQVGLKNFFAVDLWIAFFFFSSTQKRTGR